MLANQTGLNAILILMRQRALNAVNNIDGFEVTLDLPTPARVMPGILLFY